MDWYSLRVISGKEVKAKESIFIEADERGMGSFIGEIFVPTQKVIEVRQGKKKVKDKVFFPGYILINMELNKESRYIIENTPGVLNFVGSNNEPVPLRESEVSRIIGEVEKSEGKEVVECPFRIGDAVHVKDGPFDDFSGFVEEINKDKQKVKVMVSIFGRPTPVELDFYQVELEK